MTFGNLKLIPSAELAEKFSAHLYQRKERPPIVDDFSAAIETVFNYRSSKPIPLAFMADQEARRRAGYRAKGEEAA